MDICNKIKKARSSNYPFSHFYGADFFSDDEYLRLVNNLPNDSSYEDLYHADAVYAGGSTRRRLLLTPDSLKGLDSIWSNLYSTFMSPEYRHVVFKTLRKDLTTRFGTLNIKCTPTVTLYRDISGYKIAPHPDHHTKVVTTQYYLPSDSTNEDLGTELYIKEGTDYKIHKKMSFLPKHGYGFAVSENSWHGVNQITRHGVVRNSVLVIYYLDK